MENQIHIQNKVFIFNGGVLVKDNKIELKLCLEIMDMINERIAINEVYLSRPEAESIISTLQKWISQLDKVQIKEG